MFIKVTEDQPETLNKLADLPDGVYRENAQSIFSNDDASLQLVLIFYVRDAEERPSVVDALLIENDEIATIDFVRTGMAWRDGLGNESEILEELIPPRLMHLVEVQHIRENEGGLESSIVFAK